MYYGSYPGRPAQPPRDPNYDPDLEMYRQAPREPDPNHLAYLKHLVETGRLDDDLIGEPPDA